MVKAIDQNCLGFRQVQFKTASTVWVEKNERPKQHNLPVPQAISRKGHNYTPQLRRKFSCVLEDQFNLLNFSLDNSSCGVPQLERPAGIGKRQQC